MALQCCNGQRLFQYKIDWNLHIYVLSVLAVTLFALKTEPNAVFPLLAVFSHIGLQDLLTIICDPQIDISMGKGSTLCLLPLHFSTDCPMVISPTDELSAIRSVLWLDNELWGSWWVIQIVLVWHQVIPCSSFLSFLSYHILLITCISESKSIYFLENIKS